MGKNLNALRNMGIHTIDGIKNGIKKVAIRTYFIPTDVQQRKGDYDSADFALSMGLNGIPLIIDSVIDNKLSHYYLIPITTNILSGMYEWFRFERNKLENF